MEDLFIDRIRQIILDHLDDEKFGVTHLASEIGWSRSHTFRKVKSETGISVNQFIKEIRLQEAASLILNSNLNASEISYKLVLAVLLILINVLVNTTVSLQVSIKKSLPQRN